MAITLDRTTLPTITDNYVWDRNQKDFTSKEYTAPVFLCDGKIICYSEDCNKETEGCWLFSSYDCEVRGPNFIDPCLVDWAKRTFGEQAYWEWENPGMLTLAIN